MKSLPPLPIDAILPQVCDSLATTPNLVVVAEPGAGKTTRLPLALLDQPWRRDGRILVLEPRRLAARSAAAQMSRLLGEPVGQTIGYRVRLESRISATTRIEIITEGVLTRMLIEDQNLPGIAAILFDEFHERSLDGDLGLALSLDAQGALRPDLRIVVMSATLDDQRIAALLGEAPVLQSKGRAFPVETRHRPRMPHQRIDEAMADAVVQALHNDEGSILAFLPGAGEIEATRRRLEERLLPGDIRVLPLYGALEGALQTEAIAPASPGERKVVLATSIAETSLTIEGVRIVIDSGLARVPRYDPASGLTRLETVKASLASVNQRRGRAGRTEPGICVRLWTEAETRALPRFATPEIREADLAPLLLDCAACGILAPETLRFVDPPPDPALAAGRALLSELGAIDADGRLTAAGKRLAVLPLPPRLAHMLAEAPAGLRQMAGELAVLLQERGLGGEDIDLAHRLSHLARDRSERAQRARGLVKRWTDMVGGRKEPAASRPEKDAAGRLLALAFPERVAQRRPGQQGEFLLANGRGAFLDAAAPLAREAHLVVADLTGTNERARILAAAAISRPAVESLFAGRLRRADEFAFDPSSRSVRGRRTLRLGSLLLDDAPIPAGSEKATGLLVEGIAGLGIDCLPWTRSSRQLLDRARFLHRAASEEGPALDDASLSASLSDWLLPYIPGSTRLDDIGADSLLSALQGLLGTSLRRLDVEAPTHFEAPTGSSIAINYDPERGPVVAVRVQELFGLNHHPKLAGGAIPITFDLLSPAHRPIQTTRDLPRFWRGSWADVRSDMRGRYPRHEWPEDPANAQPTRRAKPRRP